MLCLTLSILHLEQNELTEIRDPRIAWLHLISNTENRRNLHKRRRHNLTVKYRFTKVPGRLCPLDPPLRLRWLIRPPSTRRHFLTNHKAFFSLNAPPPQKKKEEKKKKKKFSNKERAKIASKVKRKTAKQDEEEEWLYNLLVCFRNLSLSNQTSP